MKHTRRLGQVVLTARRYASAVLLVPCARLSWPPGTPVSF